MKKKLLLILLLAASFSLAGCSENQTQPADDEDETIYEEAVTDVVNESLDDLSIMSPVEEKKTDYFALLDEGTKSQVLLISEKLPELTGEHQYVFVSDLDANGRTEIILLDPDMEIYEVSETGDSLVKTAHLENDIPELYPPVERLMLADETGKNHYVWVSLADESDTLSRESEKEYVYENGQLTVKNIRSRKYDMFSGAYVSYSTENAAADYTSYSSVLASLCFRSGYTLKKNSMGMIYAEDVKSGNQSELIQYLSEARRCFTVTDPGMRYSYGDLEGKWNRRSGFYTGDENSQGTSGGSMSLAFHSDAVDIIESDSVRGEYKTENLPVSFRFDTSYETELWNAVIADSPSLKYASVRLSADGKLIMRAQVINDSGQAMPVEWIFEKDGWSYAADPSYTIKSNNNQEQNNSEPFETAAVSLQSGTDMSAAVAELKQTALSYYERKNSTRPEKADVQSAGEEWKYTVRLYEENEENTAAAAWYTIDIRYMTGIDELTGEQINLNS